MFGKINLLLRTVANLKGSQIFYQILNRLKGKRFVVSTKVFDGELTHLQFLRRATANQKSLGWNQFMFLSLEKNFGRYINWDFPEYGKLWTYNLEYFDYLHQEDLEIEEKLRLIDDFYKFSVNVKQLVDSLLNYEYTQFKRTAFTQKFTREAVNRDIAGSILQYI